MTKNLADKVDEIVVELLAKERTMAEIYVEFEISRETLGAINTGKKYPMEGFRYPIRRLNSNPINPNSKRQKQKEKMIDENVEPRETYTLHLPCEV